MAQGKGADSLARQRLREPDQPVNDAMLKAAGIEMLVVRVEVESAKRQAAA